MVAKRALNFGTPNSKRQKTAPMVVYRGVKPEMKYFDTIIVHTAALSSSRRINNISTGTNFNERVGNRIKMHHIEGVIVGSGSQPVRLELLMANDASITSGPNFADAVDRNAQSHLKTVFLHNGTQPNLNGYWLQHKLPYGVVSRYGDSSASSCNSNAIILSLSCPVASTITGYVRIWYTDA